MNHRLSITLASVTLFLLPGFAARLGAVSVELPAVKDGTLYQYDPSASGFNVLRSNSKGDFISSGRNKSNDQFQRGLIQFDFSAIPANATIQSAGLSLRVVDVPVNAQNTAPLHYWLLPMDRFWGEPDDGSCIHLEETNSGRGTDTLPGDVSWLHTEYRPGVAGYDHGLDEFGVQRFTPGGPGYWDWPGALEPDAGSDGRVTRPLSQSVGTAEMVLHVEIEDDFVSWSTGGMAADVQNWTSGRMENFGWCLLGDETIVGSKVSSKLGFASREYDALHGGDPWELPSMPTLTVNYTVPAVDASVAQCRLFYNDSYFDGGNAALGPADDAALASDKTPLRLGTVASSANYINFDAGINGLMIDIADRDTSAPMPTLADFTFRVGNGDDLGLWTDAPAPTAIDLRTDQGVGGADRVSLAWIDGSIFNTWLEITVRAGPATGLAADEVFYFGSAVGESGDRNGSTLVDAADLIGPRRRAIPVTGGASVENRYDYNRDGRVDSADVIVARNNVVSPLESLRLLDLRMPAAPAPVPEPNACLLAAAALLGLFFCIKPFRR